MAWSTSGVELLGWEIEEPHFPDDDVPTCPTHDDHHMALSSASSSMSSAPLMLYLKSKLYSLLLAHLPPYDKTALLIVSPELPASIDGHWTLAS